LRRFPCRHHIGRFFFTGDGQGAFLPPALKMGVVVQHSLVKLLIIPLTLFAVFLSLYLVWILIDLPSQQRLIEIATGFFERYGLITVVIAAVLEGLLLIGWYVPGTLVIVLGLIMAGDDVQRVAAVWASTVFGLWIAYFTNYFVGKYGWYRLLLAFGLKEPLDNAQRRLNRYGLSAIFMTYWQINVASLISTAAGILHLPLASFALYTLPATALWFGFWTTLIFFLGKAALTLVGLRFVLSVIAAWIVFRTIWYLAVKRREEQTAVSGSVQGAQAFVGSGETDADADRERR
jgi:membrane protein DedA with SNARE-associated domain